MRFLIPVVLLLLLPPLLTACPASDDDDTATTDDDDTTAPADDDATTPADDDDTSDWPGYYRIVRICGCEGGSPSSPGPDIDAIEIRRDTTSIGFADQITAEQVHTAGNDHAAPDAALGEPDDVHVAIGPPGSFLDLTLDLGDLDDELIQGDLISLYELDDGTNEMEHYQVLVSHDGSPDSWVVTETAIGAMSVVVHPPEVYLQGCEE